MFLIITVDWTSVLDRWGWPTLGLVGVCFILWKGAWPYVKQYLDDLRNDRIEAQRILRQRAESLEKREETQLTSFTEALEGLKNALEVSGRRQETQIMMMEETLKVSKDTNDTVKGKR